MANLNDRQSRPLFLITGMINTKDPVGYFEAFAGMARHVFTVPVPDSEAGLDPEFLADTADEAGLTAEAAEDVETAIAAICRNWNGLERPPRILIGGSLYLLGDVLRVNGTPPV
jgi:dihydrofolate synthase/folylpolyglutamate synthase